MATARTLVIGGTGVIGHFVTRQLVAAGERPVVMSPSGNTEFIADIVDSVEVVRGSIADTAAMETTLRAHGVTRIAHMGAMLHSAAEADPGFAAQIGVQGTANVLEAARRSGIKRVVFTSSKGVYGPVLGEYGHPTYRPLNEDLCPRPASVYGIMKLCSEQLGRWYRQRHGLEFAALRFASTVGPGKLRRHVGTNVHSTMIENAMLGRLTKVPAGGEAVTDTIYNDDAARGVVAALNAPTLRSDVFNIATGTGIRLPEFADAIRKIYPDAKIEIGPGTQYLRPDSTGHCVMDIARARDELGYVPDLDITGWINRYIDMMKRLRLEPASA